MDEGFVHKSSAKLGLLSVTFTNQKLGYCNELLERRSIVSYFFTTVK